MRLHNNQSDPGDTPQWHSRRSKSTRKSPATQRGPTLTSLGLGLGEVVELTDEWSHREPGLRRLTGARGQQQSTADEREEQIHDGDPESSR
jgi:hypothetical protein